MTSFGRIGTHTTFTSENTTTHALRRNTDCFRACCYCCVCKTRASKRSDYTPASDEEEELKGAGLLRSRGISCSRHAVHVHDLRDSVTLRFQAQTIRLCNASKPFSQRVSEIRKLQYFNISCLYQRTRKHSQEYTNRRQKSTLVFCPPRCGPPYDPKC